MQTCRTYNQARTGSRSSAGGVLQRKSADSFAAHEAPPIVNEVLNSPGQSLDDGRRTFDEPRFGHDFSKVRAHTDGRTSSAGGQSLPTSVLSSLESTFHSSLSSVRIHDGSNAARLAREQRANAATVGENIYFAKGRYRPYDTMGRQLLTHEIAHVLQQRREEPSSSIDASENEAHSFAERSQSASTLSVIQHGARANLSAPLLAKSKAREVIEDEVDDIFFGIDNAWPHIRAASQADRDDIRNDKVLERNIRRRASEMDLLKTYLLLTYQTEANFPAHYQAFLEATDKAGTDEARIYAILRGVTQPERAQIQSMPGVVEVIEDEMSGSELQMALRLLYEGEQHAGTSTSSFQSSTHLEVGKRYSLDVGSRQSFEEVQDRLIQAFRFGHEKSEVILQDSSLWAQFADEFGTEQVWYLRMIARYRAKSDFPVADTQTDSFVNILWDSVEGAGTKEEKLIKGLEEVDKAKSFSRGGGGWALKIPPRDEVKDEPWFVPMLKSELSGDDLREALNAVSATSSPSTGIRDALEDAVDDHDMARIRTLLGDPKLSGIDRGKLRDDPVILDEMGEELNGAQLCETTQLLKYGSAGVPKLVADLLAFFQQKPIKLAEAVSYLENLSAADQNSLLEEPGVYFMLSNSNLPDEQEAQALAAIRSKDPTWQVPGSEGKFVEYTENVSTTLPVSFTSSEARVTVRLNIDTSAVPKEDGKPYEVAPGKIEDWVRKIDEVWNNRFRIKSGATRLALVFVPYIAAGIAPPKLDLIIEPGNGRASAQYPTMRLFQEDFDTKTIAHEFGHLLGNPDEYKLTPSEYTRIGGKPGKAPRGGETVEGLMGNQTESTKIAERHATPVLEIINAARDHAVYPDPFVLEKL
jgi:Domain of unknown function (DUF4157)